MTRSSIQDSLVVPDVTPAQTATYSEYVSERQGPSRTSKTRDAVLPKFDDIAVKRDGNQRWLLIQATPEQVWPKVVDYWRDNGILLSTRRHGESAGIIDVFTAEHSRHAGVVRGGCEFDVVVERIEELREVLRAAHDVLFWIERV